MTKTIQFLGKERPVAFNMAAQLAFEKMCGKSFGKFDGSAEQKIALYYACILAADKATDLTIDNILNDAGFNELRQLDITIGELMQEYYDIPETVPEDEPSTNEDEDGSPNH